LTAVGSALRNVTFCHDLATMMDKPPAKRALDAAAEPAPTAPIAPKRTSAKVRAAIGFM
jgi:hypothetical protein